MAKDTSKLSPEQKKKMNLIAKMVSNRYRRIKNGSSEADIAALMLLEMNPKGAKEALDKTPNRELIKQSLRKLQKKINRILS